MNNQMQEKDMMLDVLTSQKQTANSYSVVANECACPSLRKDMLSMLQEEHEIQADMWGKINSHGWYPTTPAEQQKIDQARQKYQMQK